MIKTSIRKSRTYYKRLESAAKKLNFSEISLEVRRRMKKGIERHRRIRVASRAAAVGQFFC